MKKRDISFGILLVCVGVLFLLYNLNIISINMALFILSVGLLAGYFLGGSLLYLISGLVLLGVSVVYVLNEYAFPNVNIKGFLFLSIFAIISLALFIRQKSRLFLIGSLTLGSFAFHSLIKEVTFANATWSLFLLFGISFFIYYFVGYRELNIVWPKNIGIGLCIVSLVLFIASRTNVNITFWKFINYLWPIALIAIGFKIIYNIRKYRN